MPSAAAARRSPYIFRWYDRHRSALEYSPAQINDVSGSVSRIPKLPIRKGRTDAGFILDRNHKPLFYSNNYYTTNHGNGKAGKVESIVFKMKIILENPFILCYYTIVSVHADNEGGPLPVKPRYERLM